MGKTLTAAAVLSAIAAIFVAAASAGPAQPSGCQLTGAGPVRYSFVATVCGPTHVVRNTQHTYGVALKNYGKKNFRTVRLTVIHYDPISRSSIPYRHSYNRFFHERAAHWTLHNFKPGQYFRVNITLPFKQHNDPKGSNLLVLVRGLHPSFGRPERQDDTKDIIFVR